MHKKHFLQECFSKGKYNKEEKMVEPSGIEPLTSTMPS
jgi:hypothetical protein